MIHPNTKLQYISKALGYGVVATKFIPAGTITWVLDELDQEFTPSQVDEMDDIYKNILDIYSYRNNKGNYVLCWDNGRFVNHSFNSNCFTTPYEFEIAVRDIQPGEQLTDDYGYLNVSSPFRGIPEGTKRKVVYPDDLVKYAKVWDKKLAPAFMKILSREQPLKRLFTEEKWGKIESIMAGEQPLDSLLTCHYQETEV
ncbi:SET domain-containing protein [Fulvivirga sediminis]|uniref:SET domain-containing protein n=1 Tax=Fulvivirga sediminis TaxID=2803949 RepID=A0A937K1C7_9BACT|nr:SET domain-containing protein [Fulvivirga sediminis]MBL3656517.1 SET domain-containing protein [Fulvivirga sediminis]